MSIDLLAINDDFNAMSKESSFYMCYPKPITAEKANFVLFEFKCTASLISISKELAFKTSLRWLKQSGIL
jgi:hypothetical protein